jgi:hypothetical protein
MFYLPKGRHIELLKDAEHVEKLKTSLGGDREDPDPEVEEMLRILDSVSNIALDSGDGSIQSN